MDNIIKSQIDKYNNKFTIKEIEKKIIENKQTSLKIDIKKGKIKMYQFTSEIKKNRKNALENFLKEVAKKFPKINTTIFCNINDWSCPLESHLPVFVMSGNVNNRNLIIPDYLFLRDYSKRQGRNNDILPMDEIIKNYYKKEWIEKKDKCLFRAGTSKNKVIINMFKNSNDVDADWSKNSFLSYKQMFNFKFIISHYMRWDSIYMFLKSKNVVFLYKGFNQYLWYDLFLKNGENYLEFNNEKELYDKLDYCRKNEEFCINLIKNTNNICEKYFNMEFAVKYVGNLILSYQKDIIS